MSKLYFIGAGKMAGALAGGVVRSGVPPDNALSVLSKSFVSASSFSLYFKTVKGDPFRSPFIYSSEKLFLMEAIASRRFFFVGHSSCFKTG